MPQPAAITFNELNGEECAQVLRNRFEQFLEQVPHFQRHLTLPRVRITLHVRLEIWADQPKPETVDLNDRITVLVERNPAAEYDVEAESVDTAAPVKGGHPPDQIREMHGLPISHPGPGPREIGGQAYTSDNYPQLDGHVVQGLPGLRVSRTGSGEIDGMAGPQGATIAKIDQGPAGLRSGQMNRDRYNFGGKK